MRDKIKPPAQPKVELMREASDLLELKHPTNPMGAIEYLLNFFTSADLVGIIAELRK